MKIFLSYITRGKDREVAEKLRRELEERGHEVWDASVEINIGDSIFTRIQQAIREADVVAVLLSKDSTQSPWQITETSIALSHPEESQKIIPVSIGENAELPPILSSYQGLHIANDADLSRAADAISSAANTPVQTSPPDLQRTTSPDQAVEWAREMIELEKERSINSSIERESVIRRMFLVALSSASVVALVLTLFANNDAWTSIVGSFLAAASGSYAVLNFSRWNEPKDREGHKRG